MERSGFSYKLSREPAFCGVLVSCKGNPSVLKATSWDKEPKKRVHSGGGGERWTALLCDDSPPRAWSGIQALPSVMPTSCPCWTCYSIPIGDTHTHTRMYNMCTRDRQRDVAQVLPEPHTGSMSLASYIVSSKLYLPRA